jgi:protein-tyrosine phosphatase
MKKVLFVCLGNICRSPVAEGVFNALVKEKGLENEFFIDSAGILDIHKGELPDHRTRRSASERGYILDSRSRPVKSEDFERFDYIVGMDNANIRALKHIAPNENSARKILLMSDFLSKYNYDSIPDPYYGGKSDFELVIDLLEDACDNLFNRLNQDLSY